MSQLILDLTKQFEKLDQLINIKSNSIIRNYEQNINKLKSQELFENDYAKYLNDNRQFKLEQLIEKRNLQLTKINELKEESSDPDLFLKMYEVSVEPNLIQFNKSQLPCINIFFNQFNLIGSFDFFQINKYYNFIFQQNVIKLNLPDGYSIKILNKITRSSFLILPNNQIGLLVDVKKSKDRFLIVDSNGNIRHTKKLSEKFKARCQLFDLVCQNIIYMYRNNYKAEKFNIEVYNMELKLLNRFSIKRYYFNFVTYKNFFFSSFIDDSHDAKKIFYYDLINQKMVHLNLNCDIKQNRTVVVLFHFDGKYYYLNNDINCIYLIDCNTLNIHKTIKTKGDHSSSVFKVDNHGNIIQFHYSPDRIHVFSSNGIVKSIPSTNKLNDKYYSLEYTKFGNVVSNKDHNEEIIKYDVY